MFVRTKPEARSVRIRFGLISSQKAYLDIDALR
jgi:hypothetical protein